MHTQNPKNPALSLVWRSILTEEPKYSSSAWAEISDEAKSFVSMLLNKWVWVGWMRSPESHPGLYDC